MDNIFNFQTTNKIELTEIKNQFCLDLLDLIVISERFKDLSKRAKDHLDDLEKIDTSNPTEEDMKRYDASYKAYSMYEKHFMETLNMVRTLRIGIKLVDKILDNEKEEGKN